MKTQNPLHPIQPKRTISFAFSIFEYGFSPPLRLFYFFINSLRTQNRRTDARDEIPVGSMGIYLNGWPF